MQTRSVVQVGATLLILAACGLCAGCVEAKQDAQPASVPAATAASTATPASDSTVAISELPPGAYVTESGWGRLVIAQAQDGTATFTLETENAGDGCSFSGRLQGHRATVYDGGVPGRCVLDLASTPKGIRVGAATTCNAYCGHNGSYQGEYLHLAPACTPDAVAQARDRFKAAYDRHAYAEADQALAPVFRECLATLPMAEEGGVRNDYALNRHKLKDDAGCLAALERYRDDTGRSDDEIEAGMSPAIVDDYMAIIGAARTNLALCGYPKGTKTQQE